MSIFDAVTISWKGTDYTIEPDRIMGAIAKVEETITLKELGEYANKGDAPMAKLAIAYTSVMKYAGAKVNEAEVYGALFERESNINIFGCITALLAMMIPPSRDTEPKKAESPS